VTDTMVNEAWAQARTSIQSMINRWPSEAAVRNAFEQAVFRPRHMPAVANVLVGNDSTIWLQRATSKPTAEWEVRGIDGKVRGRFEVTRTFVALGASGEFIWGKELDPDGQWILIRYRIRRA
jgi:hypothetical protein